MRTAFTFILAGIILLFSSCNGGESREHYKSKNNKQQNAINKNDKVQSMDDILPPEPSDRSGKELAQAYCQSCHKFPEPNLLDVNTWEKYVLPKMGYYLGHGDPYSNPGLTEVEIKILKEENVYPEKAVIAYEDWEKIIAYYSEESPREPIPEPARRPIKVGLDNFKLNLSPFRTDPPFTSMVKIDERNQQIYVGDSKEGSLFILDNKTKPLRSIKVGEGGPSSMQFVPNGFVVSVIGHVYPSDEPIGKYLYITTNKENNSFKGLSLLNGLSRPVHATYDDLNSDNKADILVCGFGHKAGNLSWFENIGNNEFKKHELRDAPGAIKAYIKDLDNDGDNDIISLNAQGDEGIYKFINNGQGSFKQERILRFSPSNGSSYFELTDMNDDGLDDIIYTCGDNGDYPPIFKYYHGVYIFINQGDYKFKQEYFYFINGAYKAIARDYDQDGDKDIAAISFFPNFKDSPEESFVYLENDGNMNFEASTFEQGLAGRWLTMDAGDIDADGDVDIVLGSFVEGPSPAPKALLDSWRKEGSSIAILENTLN